jgi:hypothetical protein
MHGLSWASEFEIVFRKWGPPENSAWTRLDGRGLQFIHLRLI